MSRYLRADMRFATPNGPRIVISVLQDEKLVQLFNPESKETELLGYRDVRKHISDGTFVLQEKNPIGSVVSATATTPALLHQHHNLLIVDELLRRIRKGATPRAAVLALQTSGLQDADGNAVPLCSNRTMFRLLRRRIEGNKTLLPRFDLRGNRVGRYPALLVDLILQLVDEFYAQPQSRINLQQIAFAASRRGSDSGLLSPGVSVTYKFVRRIVVTMWNPDLDFRRLDWRIARAAKAVAAEKIYVASALQRVEMDTVNLPFVLRAHRVIYTTVNLMIAIDCATSLVVGWWFMLAAPTTADTLSCVSRILFSKRQLLSDLGVEATVDPYGLCIELVVDNGPENKGPQIDRLSTIGINLTRTPVNSPQKKPFVERINRSLKEALQTLPGCTRFNGKDGARTEAALHDALMTPRELEQWIVRWMHQSWAHHVLQRFVTESYHTEESPGLTPAARWQYFENTLPLPLSPRREDVAALSYLKVTRSLSPKTGIPLEGFRFKGENLRRLIQEYGPDAVVEVFYDPNDYRVVKVISQRSGELLTLVNTEALADGPAYTFKEFKAIKAGKAVEVRALPTHPHAELFDRDLAAAAFSKPAGRAAKKAQHQAVRAEQAVRRAVENPLPVTSPAPLAPSSHISEDAIPSFTVARSAAKSSRGQASK
ncbi:hypothetical protein GCM10025771_08100 [Niveibacterium umoris]|uniref:Putative transposase n=1 Tax=Niveibacterium umoris TaxID=1193620 RepID=A0A840BLY1_9RHOO|nr:hypothetical protein [Niveibacterium umoris]MBB4013643.1 putative transposase [Niveibacterium umoris]